MPLFETDTDGSAPKNKYIMGRRNWCAVKWDSASGDLVFDIRVEKQKGYGETVGYVHDVSFLLHASTLTQVYSYIARAPPPRWSP